MVSVTAADLQKHFGRYREKALKEPVSVTHHGRDSLVIMSAEEFARLKSLDTRQALYPWELPDDLARALDMSVPAPETYEFDHEK